MPHPLSHRLGRLVEERTGLSLYQFAQRIGANASGLYKIDRGERDSIDTATFDKIAGGLRMTPAELATQLEGKAPATMDADPGLLHVISVWKHLSDERRESILTLSGKVQPTRTSGNRRTDATANRAMRAIKRATGNDGDANDGSVTQRSHPVRGRLAFSGAGL